MSYYQNVLNKLNNGSGNYKVLEYLMNGGEITVQEARDIGLTNDLRSRISDLKNKHGVDILYREIRQNNSKYHQFYLPKTSAPRRIKVKNAKGKWLFGIYLIHSNSIRYDDGREQKLDRDIETLIKEQIIIEVLEK